MPKDKDLLLKSIERYTKVISKAREVSKELKRVSPSLRGASKA